MGSDVTFVIDKTGRRWDINDVVVWYGPEYVLNGVTVHEDWEVVCPVRRKCLEHFKSKEEVEEYARMNNLNIVEWA